MITESKFIEESKQYGVPVASIKAVARVEGGGQGFAKDGRPLILFEPHIFWRMLQKRGKDPAVILQQNPTLSDILYPVWNTRPYPGTQAERWHQLDRAAAIDRECALMSASWGTFQIMGFNYSAAGFKSVQAFVNAMFVDMNSHLDAFTAYISNAKLVQYLKGPTPNFTMFARHYNGPLYYKNDYDGQLARAFKLFS